MKVKECPITYKEIRILPLRNSENDIFNSKKIDVKITDIKGSGLRRKYNLSEKIAQIL